MTIRAIGYSIALLAACPWTAFGQSTVAAERPAARIVVFRDSLRLIHCDTPPLFRENDIRAFGKWVDQRIKKPPVTLGCSPIPLHVVVSFVIDTTGRLTDIRVLQTPGRSLSDEAVRALESSPRWKPGETNGRKVPVEIMLPVDFRRQN